MDKNLKARSHQVKANAKAKKIRQQSEEIKRKKIQTSKKENLHLSRSLSLSLDVS